MRSVVGCLLPLLAAVVVVNAGPSFNKPQVTVGLNVGGEGTSGSLGGLEPRIKWQTSGSLPQGIDVEGGIDVTITEIDEPPTTYLWGKLKKHIFGGGGGGDISIRGDMDGVARDSIALDVRADGFFDTSLQLTGNADLKSPSVGLTKVQLTKTIDVLDHGELTIQPKFDLDKSAGDVVVGYAMDNTSLRIDAAKKKLTIAHTFENGSGGDTIIPSITASGDFSLSHSRSLSGGRLTTTYTPDDSIQVKWSVGEWDATIMAPLDGLYKTNEGIKVNMKGNANIL